MPARLPFLAILSMGLLSHFAIADLSFPLTTHTEKFTHKPRAFGTGRSRPRRQDVAPGLDMQAGDHTPIPLNSQASNGVLYTIDVDIAGVSLPVLVDTGSSQFWVASQNCPTCTATRMVGAAMPVYEPCVNTPMNYLQGQVSGCMTTQDVGIGGYQLPAQKVVAAQELTGDFANQILSMSGILGVARGSDDGIFGVPVIQKLYDSGQISSPTIGFYLNRDWQTGGKGEVSFGDVTKSSHVDVTKSVRLPSTDDRLGLYHVRMDGMRIGASEVVSGRTVTVDTGLTNLMVPEELLPGIYRTLNVEQEPGTYDGSYLVRCSRHSGVSDLALVFGGISWSIEYQDIVGAAVLEVPGYCRGKIVATAGSKKDLTWIGAVFLKNVYTAFDTSNGSVTFYGLK